MTIVLRGRFANFGKVRIKLVTYVQLRFIDFDDVDTCKNDNFMVLIWEKCRMRKEQILLISLRQVEKNFCIVGDTITVFLQLNLSNFPIILIITFIDYLLEI